MSRNAYVSVSLLMILLAIPFFLRYFFAVVQTTPIPTQPRGLTIPYQYAREAGGLAGGLAGGAPFYARIA
ncbi:MAG: hypothetical protein PHY82_09465 [Lentisphaeria bacterium]|nr:hypothetical protein [Lentisphaeria bacterium]